MDQTSGKKCFVERLEDIKSKNEIKKQLLGNGLLIFFISHLEKKKKEKKKKPVNFYIVFRK